MVQTRSAQAGQVYLDRQTVSEFLGGLRSIASPGSALAGSLAFRQEGEDPNQVVAAAKARCRSGRMEPWLTILSVSEYSMLPSQAGWVISYASEAGGNSGRLLLVTVRPNASLEEQAPLEYHASFGIVRTAVVSVTPL